MPLIGTIEGFRSGPAKKINLGSALRISMPVTILLFCAGFNYSYVYWVSPTWSYMGVTYKSPDMALVVVAYLLASVVCALSPLRIRRPSQIIYWFLFFTVYIPGLFVPLYLQLDNGFTLLLLQLSLAAGMLLIGISYKLRLLNMRLYPVDQRLFWGVFSVLFLLGNAAVLYSFNGKLHLASYEEVYAVRMPAKQILAANPAIGYIIHLLSLVMNPLLMGYGLVSRRKKLFVLGMLGEVFLYTTGADKQLMAAPIIVFILYYTIKRDRGGWAPKMGLFFAAIFFVLTTMAITAKPGAIFNLSSFVLVRSFAAPGVEMGQYQYFFENLPHTYLGNVTGINLFVANPYARPMGEEVTSFYGITSKYGAVNANATFFASDGIGGFGLPGIPLMGILCALVFWILDSCARKYPLKFSVPALALIIVSLTNVSLFSTLAGNGLIVWILLFIIMPRDFSRIDSSS
jgi:hypothetical protein